ncbi:MAG: hypothetical protein P0119_22765 [Nitrospira sp.]|nr:hypothetical protein [Nitrospira sp.]
MTSTRLVPDLGYVQWDWAGGGQGGFANYQAQTAQQIIYLIRPWFPKPIGFGDVLEAYGEPTEIIARVVHPPDAGVGTSYDLRVIYKDQGILLLSGGVNKPRIEKETEFDQVMLFAPDAQGYAAALSGAANYPEWVQPWEGMKDFNYYCQKAFGEKDCADK